MNTFGKFVEAEHKKRVNHLVRYIRSKDLKGADRNQLDADAMAIFGFCQKDVQLIIDDALAAI